MKKIKGVEIINLDKFSDERGCLIKAVKKEYVKDEFGEIYITFTNPKHVRANHYHKKTTEWFYAVKGTCSMLLKHEKNQMFVELSEKKPQLVKIPTFVKHAIKNTGKEELILLAFTNKPYAPQDTIKSNLKFE